MRPIIITQTNLDDDSFQNIYTYKFPTGNASFSKHEIALSSISMYYSWFNITDSTTGGQYNNNTFQYIWPWSSTGGINTTPTTVTIIPGHYDIATLNAFFQTVMQENGHYYTDISGNYLYYMEFVENATYYSIQVNYYLVPNQIETLVGTTGELTQGKSTKTGLTTFVHPGAGTTSRTPQLVVPTSINTNSFSTLLGITSGTYPVDTSTNIVQLSDFTPQLSPVSSIILSCSLLNNPLAQPTKLLYAFSPSSVSFGSLININPPHLAFTDITPGEHNQISIEFFDQNLNKLPVQDTNIVVLLMIQEKTK